jgi:hypothetical protein
VAVKPIKRNRSETSHHFADVALAGLHVSRGANNEIVPCGSERMQALDGAWHWLQVGILLAWLAELADHSIQIDTNLHAVLCLWQNFVE